MENIDNNIIVNVKPYKVLLQTSEDGVEGGYYDADETWHEFGSGGSGLITVSVSVTEDSTTGVTVNKTIVPDEEVEGLYTTLNDYIDIGETKTVTVLPNFINIWCFSVGEITTLVSGTAKTKPFDIDGFTGYVVYFDEDGQTALLKATTGGE